MDFKVRAQSQRAHLIWDGGSNYTNYFPTLSPFYNNKNTITPTTFFHYLHSIIIKRK